MEHTMNEFWDKVMEIVAPHKSRETCETLARLKVASRQFQLSTDKLEETIKKTTERKHHGHGSTDSRSP